jgi:hypothetical protein
MKLRPLMIAILLICGVAANVAVAWGLRLYKPDIRAEDAYFVDEQDVLWWQKNVPAGIAIKPLGKMEGTESGFYWAFMYEREPDESAWTLGDNVLLTRSGWPCLALEGSVWVGKKTRTVVGQHCFQLPSGWPLENRVLPSRPLWFGFTVNSLFYAVVAGGCVWIGLRIRRFLRLRRRVCPTCKYPFGIGTVCTECSAKLPNPAPTHAAGDALAGQTS